LCRRLFPLSSESLYRQQYQIGDKKATSEAAESLLLAEEGCRARIA
jgi:hypothetical protein